MEGLAQWPFGGYTNSGEAIFAGALYANPKTNIPGSTSGSDYYLGAPGIAFDASRDDATYSGDKVQMSALQTLCCIKF